MRVVAVHQRLQTAKIGWRSIDDWEHTHNRRWIRRVGAEVVDPFGGATGRTNMHPGDLSKDVIGPSGPVEKQLTLRYRTPDKDRLSWAQRQCPD